MLPRLVQEVSGLSPSSRGLVRFCGSGVAGISPATFTTIGVDSHRMAATSNSTLVIPTAGTYFFMFKGDLQATGVAVYNVVLNINGVAKSTSSTGTPSTSAAIFISGFWMQDCNANDKVSLTFGNGPADPGLGGVILSIIQVAPFL